MPTPTPPAPSLQGKTPDREMTPDRFFEVWGPPIMSTTKRTDEVWAAFEADLASLLAAARLAALEEAAQRLEATELPFSATVVRSLASSPAPAKRAETEGGGDGA